MLAPSTPPPAAAPADDSPNTFPAVGCRTVTLDDDAAAQVRAYSAAVAAQRAAILARDADAYRAAVAAADAAQVAARRLAWAKDGLAFCDVVDALAAAAVRP